MGRKIVMFLENPRYRWQHISATVLASGDDYVDAGFTPVKLSLKAVAMVDLMLLADDADFKFLSWEAIKTADTVVSSFISVGHSDEEAQAHYDSLRQTKPAALASLLNLATAMKVVTVLVEDEHVSLGI